MKRTRHTPEQVINKLREADALMTVAAWNLLRMMSPPRRAWPDGAGAGRCRAVNGTRA